MSMNADAIYDPRVLDLAARLKIAPYAAVGLLKLLTDYEHEYCDDEHADNVEISNAIGWDGDPDAFVAALLASGCLVEGEPGARGRRQTTRNLWGYENLGRLVSAWMAAHEPRDPEEAGDEPVG